MLTNEQDVLIHIYLAYLYNKNFPNKVKKIIRSSIKDNYTRTRTSIRKKKLIYKNYLYS